MGRSRPHPAVPEGVVLGEALDVMAGLPPGCADLVYLDPPFGTGQTRRLQTIRTGRGRATRRGFGGRPYTFEVVAENSYADGMPLEAYLGFLAAHLEAVHRVLAPTGSLYVHLDFRAAHHARLVLDEIFGADRLVNEIVWAYDYGGRPKNRWPRKHDTLFWYAKSKVWTFNADEIERIPYMAPGLVGPEKAARGKLPTDVWWLTIVPTSGAERTGYPTQKPERLLERIVAASSKPDDFVCDFFAGSGTTGAVCRRLGRRFLLVDNNPAAVEIMHRRLGR